MPQTPPIARCLAVEKSYESLFHPISLLKREVYTHIELFIPCLPDGLQSFGDVCIIHTNTLEIETKQQDSWDCMQIMWTPNGCFSSRLVCMYYTQLLQLTGDLETWSTIPLPAPVSPTPHLSSCPCGAPSSSQPVVALPSGQSEVSADCGPLAGFSLAIQAVLLTDSVPTTAAGSVSQALQQVNR